MKITVHVNVHGITNIITVVITCKPVGGAEGGADVCFGDEGKRTVEDKGRWRRWSPGCLQLLDRSFEKILHLERRVKTRWTGTRGAVAYLVPCEGRDLLWRQPFEIDIISLRELGENFAVEFCGKVCEVFMAQEEANARI